MATRRTGGEMPLDGDDGDTPHGAALSTLPPDLVTEETELDRVLALMSGAPEDRASLKLYRRIPGDSKGAYIDDISIHEYGERGLSYVREMYGPGSYILWLYGPHPLSGKVGRLAREQFTIEASRDIAAPVAVANSAQSETAQMLRMMQEQNAAILAALTQRPDPMAEMQRTIALMASMREAMGLNAQPAAPAVVAPNPSAMLGELVGAIKQLREVSSEINPQAPTTDPESPMALVGNIIDLVKTAVQNPQVMATLQNAGGAMGQQVQPLALPNSLTAAAPLPVQSETAEVVSNPAPVAALSPEQEMQRAILQGALQGIVDMAAQGATPEAGGDYIAETLPDELLPYLRLPNWFQLLTMAADQVGVNVRPHAEWIAKAKAEADRILSAPEPD